MDAHGELTIFKERLKTFILEIFDREKTPMSLASIRTQTNMRRVDSKGQLVHSVLASLVRDGKLTRSKISKRCVLYDVVAKDSVEVTAPTASETRRFASDSVDADTDTDDDCFEIVPAVASDRRDALHPREKFSALLAQMVEKENARRDRDRRPNETWERVREYFFQEVCRQTGYRETFSAPDTGNDRYDALIAGLTKINSASSD